MEPGDFIPRWGGVKDPAWVSRNLPLSEGWVGLCLYVEERDSYVYGTPMETVCVCVCVCERERERQRQRERQRERQLRALD